MGLRRSPPQTVAPRGTALSTVPPYPWRRHALRMDTDHIRIRFPPPIDSIYRGRETNPNVVGVHSEGVTTPGIRRDGGKRGTAWGDRLWWGSSQAHSYVNLLEPCPRWLGRREPGETGRQFQVLESVQQLL